MSDASVKHRENSATESGGNTSRMRDLPAPRGPRAIASVAAVALVLNLGAGVAFLVERAAASNLNEVAAEADNLKAEALVEKDKVLSQLAVIKADREALMNERDSLVAEVASAKKEAEGWADRATEARSAIEEADARQGAIKVLFEQKDLLSRRLGDLEAEISSKQVSKDVLVDEARSLESKVAGLETQVASLNAKQKGLLTSASEASAAANNAESALQELKTLKAEKSKVAAELQQLKGQQTALTSEIRTLQAGLGEFDAKQAMLTKARSERDAIQTEISGLTGTRDRLKGERDTLLQQVGTLHTDLGAAEQDLRMVKRQIEQAKSDLSTEAP